MPFAASPVRLPTLLVGALLLAPGAPAQAGDPEFGPDAHSEFLASLANDPEAQAAERARASFVRDLAQRFEDRANERIWLSFSPGKTGDREVLSDVEPPPDPPKASLREHFRLTFRRGVEYRHKFDLWNEQLSLRVWGPVVGSKPGLGVSVDGGVQKQRMRVKAYGNTEEVGLQLDFEL